LLSRKLIGFGSTEQYMFGAYQKTPHDIDLTALNKDTHRVSLTNYLAD